MTIDSITTEILVPWIALVIQGLLLFFTVLIAVRGWKEVRLLSIEESRRKYVYETLSEVIVALVQVGNKAPEYMTDAEKGRMERTLPLIQLLGTLEQVEMARDVSEELTQGGKVDMDPLINSLRDYLRGELALDSVSGNIFWIRYLRSSEITEAMEYGIFRKLTSGRLE